MGLIDTLLGIVFKYIFDIIVIGLVLWGGIWVVRYFWKKARYYKGQLNLVGDEIALSNVKELKGGKV